MMADTTQHALALAAAEWGGTVTDGKLVPIAEQLGQLVLDDENACHVAGDWHPVCVEPGQEKLARDEISANGLPSYLPMLWVNEGHGRGQVRTVERPMFGSYLFVRCIDAEEQWQRVTSARGARRLLVTATGRMGVIPEIAIHAMRLAEWENWKEHEAIVASAAEENARLEEAATRRAAARSVRELAAVQRQAAKRIVWNFTPEQQVRIKAGPFAGFYARLTNAVDQRGRIDVLVDLFRGSTKANLSPFDIEAL